MPSPRTPASDNNSDFDGEGDSAQSNQLEGDITVTVAQRLANGNLLVRGQKWIGINQGKEFVRIQGVIRPIDIEPDNSMLSSQGGRRVDLLRRQGRAGGCDASPACCRASSTHVDTAAFPTVYDLNAEALRIRYH